ncbi:MAG: hypothetical protein RLZZ283_736 [Candidatus Parcubacteria bacterium]|jgi:hypothetical protein
MADLSREAVKRNRRTPELANAGLREAGVPIELEKKHTIHRTTFASSAEVSDGGLTSKYEQIRHAEDAEVERKEAVVVDILGATLELGVALFAGIIMRLTAAAFKIPYLTPFSYLFQLGVGAYAIGRLIRGLGDLFGQHTTFARVLDKGQYVVYGTSLVTIAWALATIDGGISLAALASLKFIGSLLGPIALSGGYFLGYRGRTPAVSKRMQEAIITKNRDRLEGWFS